jgi:hypothetical protein
LILSELERCESAVWVKMCEVLVTRKIRLAGDVYPGGPTGTDDPAEEPRSSSGGQRGVKAKEHAARERGREREEGEDAGAELADDVEGAGGSREWDLADCLVVWVRDEEESEKCSSWLVSVVSRR